MRCRLRLGAASALLIACAIAAAGFSSAAWAQVSIPLQLLEFSGGTGLQTLTPSSDPQFYRLVINVGVGGGAPQPYLFDTGSPGFNAALSPSAMPTQTVTPLTPSGQQVFLHYGSGQGYLLNQVAVPSLSFFANSSSTTPAYTLPTLSPGYQVNLVAQHVGDSGYFGTPSNTNVPNRPTQGSAVVATNSDTFYQDTSFNNYVKQGVAPIEGYLYGTFGASDFVTQANLYAAPTGTNTLYSSTSNTALAGSVLGQSTTSGYAVSANAPIFAQGAPQSAATAALFKQITCSPCVTLGLSSALTAQFASIVPWNNPSGIGTGNYPNSGANSSTEDGVTFKFGYTTAPGQPASQVSYSGPTLLDSGTQNMNLGTPNSSPSFAALGSPPFVNPQTGNLYTGTTVTISGSAAGNLPTSFTANDSQSGTNPNVTYQVFSPYYASNDNQIGIGFFLENSVLFNLSGEAVGYSSYFVTAAPLITTSAAPIVIDNTAGPMGLAEIISGSGPLTIAAGGIAQLSGANTYTGLTTIAGASGGLGVGQLYIVGPGSIAASAGLVDNGYFDISGASAPVAISTLSGTGQINLGPQALVLTNAAGTFAGSIGDGGAGGGLVLASGTETLSGTSSLGGGTLVAGGALTVSGNLTSGVAIAPGGLLVASGTIVGNIIDGGYLAGHGTINGNLAVASGGAIVSTGTPGTMAVNGSVAFQPGTAYQVAIGAPGTSDRLAISGAAALGGIVSVLPVSGFTGQLGNYTILTAGGGVSGQFAGVTTPFGSSYYPFLSARLSDPPASVQLTIGKGAPFATAAATANQAAAGNALDALPISNSLLQAASLLNYATAPAALTALSGDIYGSTESVMQQRGAALRDAIGARLRQATAPEGAPQVAALEPVAVPVMPGSPVAIWQQALGAWGTLGSAGNATGIDSTAAGYIVGIDAPLPGPLFDGWRAGLAGGFDRTWFNSTGTAANATLTGPHLAGYAGARWNQLGIDFGASNTWYSGSSTRTVALPGVVNSDTGGIGGTVTQVFGEASWDEPVPQLMAGAVAEPFVDVAYAHVASDGFTETGGISALSVGSATLDDTYTTLGARGSVAVDLGTLPLKVDAVAGWQHTFGATVPGVSLAFVNGAAPFSVQGVPIARDTAVVGAGLCYDASPSLSFAVGYIGRIASGVQDNQVHGSLTLRF